MTKQTASSGMLFPVLLDLGRKHVLVIGEGDALTQPVLSLLPCAGALYAADLSGKKDLFSDKLCQLSGEGRLTLFSDGYKREMLYGMDIVISLSDDGPLNDELFASCRTLGICIAILSQPGRSDFIPAAF